MLLRKRYLAIRLSVMLCLLVGLAAECSLAIGA